MTTGPRINLVVLRCADIDQSVALYRLIGISFEKHAHSTGPMHYAANCKGTIFELYPATAKFPVTKGIRIGFRVDDLDRITAAAIEHGATLVTAPEDSPWGRRSVIRDPDGYTIELSEGA